LGSECTHLRSSMPLSSAQWIADNMIEEGF
jgi:hypothetical protein